MIVALEKSTSFTKNKWNADQIRKNAHKVNAPIKASMSKYFAMQRMSVLLSLQEGRPALMSNGNFLECHSDNKKKHRHEMLTANSHYENSFFYLHLIYSVCHYNKRCQTVNNTCIVFNLKCPYTKNGQIRKCKKKQLTAKIQCELEWVVCCFSSCLAVLLGGIWLYAIFVAVIFLVCSAHCEMVQSKTPKIK